jgi:hypothetical protein
MKIRPVEPSSYMQTETQPDAPDEADRSFSQNFERVSCYVQWTDW